MATMMMMELVMLLLIYNTFMGQLVPRGTEVVKKVPVKCSKGIIRGSKSNLMKMVI